MGWTIGFAIGAVVVVVVVALLLTLIGLARAIAGRAEGILGALESSAEHTRGLWELSATSATADRVVAAATGVRKARERKGTPR